MPAQFEITRQFIQSAIQHPSVAAKVAEYARDKVLPRVESQISREQSSLTASVEAGARPGSEAGGFRRPYANVVLTAPDGKMVGARRTQANAITGQVASEFDSPKGGGFG